MAKIEAKDRLIVALDVDNVDDAKSLVKKLDGVVSFFKVGLEMQIVAGIEFVRWLLDNDKKVFLDLKFFDVEETVKRAVRRVAVLGVSFLTVHGNHRIIQAAVKGRGDSSLEIMAVTVLTCLDAADIQEMGFPCSVEELVMFRAEQAVKAGCDGVIASGREAKALRQMAKDALTIVTPGIRPDGADINEHKRAVTPEMAISAGSDYLVVGRPIKNASDPRSAAIEIIRQMQNAFEKKE